MHMSVSEIVKLGKEIAKDYPRDVVLQMLESKKKVNPDANVQNTVYHSLSAIARMRGANMGDSKKVANFIIGFLNL